MNSLEQKLSRIDLNLLVAMNVLLTELHVGRAAETLFLSQSAMSRTLQRLRELFDDQLFYRKSTGLQPTVKAEQIGKVLPSLLQSLNTIFESEQFDPAEYEGDFKIALPPMMSDCFILPLVSELQKLAPKATLKHTNVEQSPLPKLATGEIDFAVFTEESNDKAYVITPLRVLQPCIFARQQHPLLKHSQLTLTDCLNYPFVDLNLENKQRDNLSNPADLMLQALGLKRKILLKSSQLSVLTNVVKNSDYLLLAANFTVNSSVNEAQLTAIYDFKEEYQEQVTLSIITHQRIHQSPAHQWFKDLFVSLFGEL
ncbi:LysR family transcriptional regulator [Vibrio breoganii]